MAATGPRHPQWEMMTSHATEMPPPHRFVRKKAFCLPEPAQTPSAKCILGEGGHKPGPGIQVLTTPPPAGRDIRGEGQEWASNGAIS